MGKGDPHGNRRVPFPQNGTPTLPKKSPPSQHNGHRTRDTGHRDTAHRTHDTGLTTQDTGHSAQDTGHRTQDWGRRHVHSIEVGSADRAYTLHKFQESHTMKTVPKNNARYITSNYIHYIHYIPYIPYIPYMH